MKAIAPAEPVDQCTGLSRRPYGAQTEARSAVYLVEFRLVARPDVCHGLGFGAEAMGGLSQAAESIRCVIVSLAREHRLDGREI